MQSSQRRLLLFGVVAIAAVSLMIYLLVNRIVLKPVNEIVAATRKVAAGDLQYMIALPKRDEIGILANSFNEMTQKTFRSPAAGVSVAEIGGGRAVGCRGGP